MEWAPGSGRTVSFPDVDDAQLLSVDDALVKICPARRGFVRGLMELGVGCAMRTGFPSGAIAGLA